MANLLVVVRAIHFASSITVAGAAFFPAAVAGEQLRAHREALAPIQRQLDWIVLTGLGLAVASGGLWLLLLASQLAQVTEDADSTVWLVLTGTQFGCVLLVRFVIAGLLALLLALRHLKPLASTLNWLIALLGIAFVVSLAWCGHSGAGLGLSGDFQVGADAVHLVTAAIWVGGLLPLLIFIRPSVPMRATERYQTRQTVLFAGNLGCCPADRKRRRQHLVHDRWDAASLRHGVWEPCPRQGRTACDLAGVR